MTDQEIQKYGEIQYLIGRLDELTLKALPNVLDLHRHRRLDARAQKYYEKLKAVDKIAYHMYLVESTNRNISKQKNESKLKEFLIEIKNNVNDKSLIEKIEQQILKL